MKGTPIISNNVFSEQSNLVYIHFYVVWPICLLFCILFFYFYGMLNVGYYFLLSYSRELAHELSTCVYVHHCAWLALLRRVFNALKWYVIQQDHTSAFLLWSLWESIDSSFCSPSFEGITGTAVITVTLAITESQPRLVTASTHLHFYGFAPLGLP